MNNSTLNKQATYIPSSSQIERKKALKRFNLLFVYLPIAFFTILILTVIGYISWLSVGVRQESMLSTVSGLADLTLILVMIPMMVIGLLGPAALFGIIYWTVKRRQAKKEQPSIVEEGILLQKYSWQAESFLDRVRLQVQKGMDKAADPVIKLNGWLDAFVTMLRQLWSKFLRS